MKVGGRSLLEASHSSSSSWPGTYETTVVAANSPLRLGINSYLFTVGVGEWDGQDPLSMPEHHKATGQYRGLDMKCPQAHLLNAWLQAAVVILGGSRSKKQITEECGFEGYAWSRLSSSPPSVLLSMSKRASSATCTHCHDFSVQVLGAKQP